MQETETAYHTQFQRDNPKGTYRRTQSFPKYKICETTQDTSLGEKDGIEILGQHFIDGAPPFT